MRNTLNMLNTIAGSMVEDFYPAGWNLRKIDGCCAMKMSQLLRPARFWHKDFSPQAVTDVAEMDRRMGDAIADEIENSSRTGQKLALILPVGPMGMYKTVVGRLRKSRTCCGHVTTFNMDEWADAQGNTMPGDAPGGFEHAMCQALFNPLGKLTVPVSQRNFATRKNLPTYAGKIAAIKKEGGRLVTVYGIGRVCHIAFWEPDMASIYTLSTWKKQTHRLGLKLHPLTVEQNAITSFNSRFTLVPCFANTVGPGLFLQSDFCIGGCDGAYPKRGAQWQGMSLCVTLQHGPSPWLTSTFMPTIAGRLFFMKALGGPLLPDAH
jgi:glucosamine-6-phosphate deaminase